MGFFVDVVEDIQEVSLASRSFDLWCQSIVDIENYAVVFVCPTHHHLVVLNGTCRDSTSTMGPNECCTTIATVIRFVNDHTNGDAAIAFNQAHNITYEAWSPMKHCPFTDPTITKIATAHKVTLTLLLLLLLFLLPHLSLVLLLLALVLILVLEHLSGIPVASLDSRQG